MIDMNMLSTWKCHLCLTYIRTVGRRTAHCVVHANPLVLVLKINGALAAGPLFQLISDELSQDSFTSYPSVLFLIPHNRHLFLMPSYTFFIFCRYANEKRIMGPAMSIRPSSRVFARVPVVATEPYLEESFLKSDR